jgi:hypothetical protein
MLKTGGVMLSTQKMFQKEQQRAWGEVAFPFRKLAGRTDDEVD